MNIRHLLDPPEKIVAWSIVLSVWASLALFSCVRPAYAGDPLNGQPNWVTAAFLTAPAAVTVDVVNVSTGTTVADDAPAVQLQIDGADSIYWRYDLSTVTGYPVGCDVKTYAIQFIPDAADCSEAVNPELCATATRQVGGASCSVLGRSGYNVHTSTVVSGQGIDQAVLDFYTTRGVLPLLWTEFDISASGSYSSPDSTVWEVYFYTSSASAPRVLCTVYTTTNPSTALPSYSHCS